MAELIYQYSNPLFDGFGTHYFARVYGRERLDRSWEAWLEFVPVDDGAAPLRTDRETEQLHRDALARWAAGVEEGYLIGALDRAQPVLH